MLGPSGNLSHVMNSIIDKCVYMACEYFLKRHLFPNILKQNQKKSFVVLKVAKFLQVGRVSPL